VFLNQPCDLARAAAGPPLTAAGTPFPKPLSLRACSHLIVVSTHLGEDISAAGALVARLADRGVRIDLLAVTDDDGAPPGSPHATPPRLLGQRRATRMVAFRRLGVRACRWDSLKLPAWKVDDAGIDVIAALSEIIGFAPAPPRSDAVWVLAPWRQDPHPDHAAVGQAAAIACHAYSARLLEYPLTGWRPDAPPRPRDNARVLPLSPILHTRKRHALAAMLHPDRVEAVAEHELYLVDPVAVDGGAPGLSTVLRG
jgi:LmbE family N-acetylglucosaminyl deacetylase